MPPRPSRATRRYRPAMIAPVVNRPTEVPEALPRATNGVTDRVGPAAGPCVKSSSRGSVGTSGLELAECSEQWLAGARCVEAECCQSQYYGEDDDRVRSRP